ncbi:MULTISPECIES: MarR family winged helix-turn-helix transcriptional regulator [unclassified Mycolicibacterium]|uniref:MarR family winged helix-turn-helix transcriptional regulator n=1 Tax=unclassified Mycolicibacterium TaxID=2636767 RepID=UPI0012DC3432|nr:MULTISPECIES: MarR family transcriptional regulator [unclassified Mycolicibacterium]MUL98466.1 MarR family transcriptional regulator [Mycolicibacterium sp. CBMA 334]MUM37549.1 MarR family transcriptional regulator [Mycolicibacterium sp. CBMA 247]MUL81486.1 MarR family transcriptional regulator [Mycolicibacterium sp. CBMA 329]MUL87252.1 MarR family transcriptional regulator [Mycolicibacterium sp. CBMA 331]MUM25223.1 MarR family transcriptional regulator [Mycolicibacterium sp. CBMA 295]
MPGLDDAEQACWQFFIESSTRLGEILYQRLLDEHDLPLVDFLLLDVLAKSDGGSARMTDLAKRLTLTPSRVTARVQRLQSRGLVERATSKDDRRSVVASITRDGRACVHHAMRTYARTVRELYLNRLSRRQMTALGDSCRRINDELQHVRRWFDSV